MTLLETLSGVRTSTPTPAVVPDPGVIKCGSCGKDASVHRWYATVDPATVPEFLCGRCAELTLGATCGVIASLIFDLGADGA